MAESGIGRLTYSRLETDTGCMNFSCGERDIDDWFRKKSKRDHAALKHIVTCVFRDEQRDRPVGFYAFSTVVEEVSKLQHSRPAPFYGSPLHFPCLNLVYLAVDRPYQGRGIGQAIMGAVVDEFVDIGTRTGLPLLTLNAMSARVAAFYGRLGFAKYKRGLGMYLPLESAVET